MSEAPIIGSNPGSSGGGAPTGAAGGSLTGTYPNPTIATIPSGATATTQTAADGSTKVATTAYVDTADALAAQKATLTTKGDIYAASAASTPARLAVGTHLTHRMVADTAASTGLKWVPHIVTRTTDATAIASNTTLASDDTLLWAMAANEVWYFMGNLIFNTANATMDIKIGLTGPASATANWGVTGNPASAMAGWGATATGNAPTSNSIAQTISAGGINNGITLIGIAGVVQNSTNAGTLNLQFAQATSDAGNLTPKAYSHLILWRLA